VRVFLCAHRGAGYIAVCHVYLEHIHVLVADRLSIASRLLLLAIFCLELSLATLQVAPNVKAAMVVPGSGLVKAQVMIFIVFENIMLEFTAVLSIQVATTVLELRLSIFEVCECSDVRFVVDNVLSSWLLRVHLHINFVFSTLLHVKAEFEGLDKILIDAGFEWREPGCSMCLAMNPDKLEPQVY